MLERYGFYVLILGALLGAIGWIWLLIRSFRERTLWGVALLLFPPAVFLFLCRHFRKVRGPVAILLLAGVVTAVPYGIAYYERHFIPLKPYEQIVDGELRITLTGLKDFDYASLGDRREVVVLQMANPEVDDRTLEHVKGMDRLRTLDLRDTGITDEGLIILAALPQLQELYLARTKITDDGFQKHLLSKESLLKVDLTGTDVKGKTKREWKNRKPEQRAYVD